MSVDFDVILQKIGRMGRSQLLMIGTIYYFIMNSGLNTIQPVFTSYSPSFRCNVPELENCSFTSFYQGLKAIAPSCDSENGNGCDGCKRLNISSDMWSCNMSHVNSSTVKTTDCEYGYIYDDSLFSSTAVTEFNLVCNRSIFKAIATSCFMFGILLGVITFGYISDRIGRWPSLVITAYGCYAVMLGAALASNYWMYLLFRVLVSFFLYGSKVCAFVFIMEISGKKYRTIIGMLFQSVFAIGYITLSGLAYRWRDWHQLQIACIIVSIPYAVLVFFIPESPRWLLSKGRTEKAKKIIHQMARLNKRPLAEKDWEDAVESSQQEFIQHKKNEEVDRKYSTIDLFRTRGICVITLGVMFNWFVNSFVYYGVSLNVGSLSGNIFLNNVLGGVIEISSNIICITTMDRFGRRRMISLLLFTAGVALLVCGVLNEIPGDGTVLRTVSKVAALIGRLGISGSYAIIYNYTSELFPTVVRANGVGMGSAAARVGGVLAPFIIMVQDHVRWLPNVIFGIFSVAAAVLALRFPETGKIELIETIEEAELFYAGKYVNGKRRITEEF